MAQILAILGFMLSLVALYLASEVLRRTNHRFTQLETELFKTSSRLHKIEGGVYHVEKLAAEMRHQRRRKSETLTALANKADAQRAQDAETERQISERFTPSSHATSRKTG